MRLTEKITIVTGAARGIGSAIAEAFVAEGAFVYVTDLDALQGRSSRQDSARAPHTGTSTCATRTSGWP